MNLNDSTLKVFHLFKSLLQMYTLYNDNQLKKVIRTVHYAHEFIHNYID